MSETNQYYIQFRFPKSIIKEILGRDISQNIIDMIKDGKPYSSINLTCKKELFEKIILLDRMVEGKNIIRLYRENIFVPLEKIDDNSFYEVKLETDMQAKLQQKPSFFYHLSVVCSNCGVVQWKQKKNLLLRKKSNSDFIETDNGEIIVSKKIKEIFEKNSISGFRIRNTNFPDLFQLEVTGLTSVIKNKFYFEKEYCSVCDRPRKIFLENSNGISLLSGSNTIPRIERTAFLEIDKPQKDFSLTKTEFGMIGRIPEGVRKIDPLDVDSKTCWPSMIVSGKVAKILLQSNIHGLRIYEVIINSKLFS